MKYNILIFFLALVINFFLLTNYKSESMDEVWSLSFYNNYINKNIETDNTFLSDLGQSGVTYFGKTTAYIYAPILNIIGWNRYNALNISFSLILISLYYFYKSIGLLTNSSNILINEKINSKKIGLIFITLLLIFEPFITTINSTRNESLLLLIYSLILFTYLKRKYFASAFLFTIALEIHPIGIVTIVPLIIHLIVNKIKISNVDLLYIFLAIIMGSMYYLFLHYNNIHNLLPFLLNNSTTTWNNLFLQYFINANYNRHIFDLLIFVILSCIYFKTFYKKSSLHNFISIYFFTSLLLMFFYPRPNINYVSLIIPGFILLASYVIYKIKWGNILLGIIFISISFQYIYLITINSKYNYDLHIDRIFKLVPNDNLPIIGSTNEWYAFKDREFYPATITNRVPEIKEFYFVEENDYRKPPYGINHDILDDKLRNCKKEKINEDLINDELFSIYKYICK